MNLINWKPNPYPDLCDLHSPSELPFSSDLTKYALYTTFSPLWKKGNSPSAAKKYTYPASQPSRDRETVHLTATLPDFIYIEPSRFPRTLGPFSPLKYRPPLSLSRVFSISFFRRVRCGGRREWFRYSWQSIRDYSLGFGLFSVAPAAPRSKDVVQALAAAAAPASGLFSSRAPRSRLRALKCPTRRAGTSEGDGKIMKLHPCERASERLMRASYKRVFYGDLHVRVWAFMKRGNVYESLLFWG